MEDIGMGSMNLEELLNNMYSDEAVEKSFQEPQMTLEAFLTKAGAVTPNDLPLTSLQFHPFETNTTTTTTTTATTSRLKRSAPERRAAAAAAEEMPMDKLSQQRQRRMIKNRESAARSRERKQAYTVELEALVMQLEEENARLVREEAVAAIRVAIFFVEYSLRPIFRTDKAERSRRRLNKLMQNLIPVEEKQGPIVRAAHRRVQSVGW